MEIKNLQTAWNRTTLFPTLLYVLSAHDVFSSDRMVHTANPITTMISSRSCSKFPMHIYRGISDTISVVDLPLPEGNRTITISRRRSILNSVLVLDNLFENSETHAIPFIDDIASTFYNWFLLTMAVSNSIALRDECTCTGKSMLSIYLRLSLRHRKTENRKIFIKC